jgi:hypothetical protein
MLSKLDLMFMCMYICIVHRFYVVDTYFYLSKLALLTLGIFRTSVFFEWREYNSILYSKFSQIIPKINFSYFILLILHKYINS